MNMLLVEDDENKRKQIGSFLSEMFRPTNLYFAKSLKSGLNAITQGDIDLIILDMTMPTFDITVDEPGGRPQPYAGREILRQMDRRRIKTPVIVVTQFDKFGEGDDALDLEELDEQLREAHPSTYCGVVYYDVAVEGWKEALTKLVLSSHKG